jgi:hypothetical protein
MSWKRKGVLNWIDKDVASLMYVKVKVREVLILKQQPKFYITNLSQSNNNWE